MWGSKAEYDRFAVVGAVQKLTKVWLLMQLLFKLIKGACAGAGSKCYYVSGAAEVESCLRFRRQNGLENI